MHANISGIAISAYCVIVPALCIPASAKNTPAPTNHAGMKFSISIFSAHMIGITTMKTASASPQYPPNGPERMPASVKIAIDAIIPQAYPITTLTAIFGVHPAMKYIAHAWNAIHVTRAGPPIDSGPILMYGVMSIIVAAWKATKIGNTMNFENGIASP